jgi:hypothetical protein
VCYGDQVSWRSPVTLGVPFVGREEARLRGTGVRES